MVEFSPTYEPFQGRNTYLHYQKSQRDFTTWLIEAAAKHGEHVQEGPSQRLEEILVPFIQLIRLAEVVAHHDVVPQGALDALDFMLRTRGQWDPKNQKIEKPVPEEENGEYEHEHFLALVTLRIVRKLLNRAPIVPHDDQRHNTPPNATSRPGVKYNGRATRTVPVTRSTIIHSLPALPGEAFFAWVCFFNDLHDIRVELMKRWHGYILGMENLITSTLVTNTAMRLIRENCEAQLKATENLTGAQLESDVIQWVYEGVTGDFGSDGSKWEG
ncbi:hypothetical protein F5Y19DRAFT_490921 [Xylariaceae sp. FL1651]|nr:hypothetical protein F5Y19DRAFT_490921 [Xylariaceae sp. FL1651]